MKSDSLEIVHYPVNVSRRIVDVLWEQGGLAETALDGARKSLARCAFFDFCQLSNEDDTDDLTKFAK